MDLFFSYLLYLIVLSTISLGIIFLAYHHKSSNSKLPPGRKGWPIIGETMQFALAAQRGNPERFINDRMNKYSPEVFRISLMEENMAVMCGAPGNKFFFSNENKLVTSWWHRSMKKILYFPSLFDNPATQDQIKTPSFLPEFLKPEALKHYVAIMDLMAGMHIDMDWAPYREVKVFPLVKKYAFALSCRLFMKVDDPQCVARISHPFELIMAGFLSVPLDIPGTAFNRAIKARNIVHKELLAIINKRKMELGQKGNSAARDFLSHMLLEANKNGEIMSETEISTHLICLLLATHDSTSAVITFVLKYLAEFPSIYNEVFKEQMEIAKGKGSEEYLNWDDIQKMRYSWNVANETMRLTPPVQGAFREVIKNFTYAGFTMPKGWKTHWNVNTTHRNPKYFPDHEKFDPSRFEGRGPEPFTFVPFGGGPRMCPGREYARAQKKSMFRIVVDVIDFVGYIVRDHQDPWLNRR
uniref:Beta-amyrin 28-monooxygenase n=1 Tax=Vitis vinifera TaxID=29760 RepID=A5BN67_VITVI|nr:hypothetical protein VITISV_036273 [Vitis vinifera]